MPVIEIGHTTTQVRVYQDPRGRYHFQAYTPGTPGARTSSMLCGRPAEGLRKRTWLTVGDHRGRMHYDKACSNCRRQLIA